jgi:uncharacterized protein
MKGAAAALPRLWLLLAALFALSAPAAAQDLPRLTGRVVDNADLLPAEHEIALTQRWKRWSGRPRASSWSRRCPSLGGRSVEDYGFALGEAWKIGEANADNGAILLVAAADRKVRIEVGDGLEPILTDAMSSIIIRREIQPRFKAGDYPGGIDAGVDAILEQLRAPPEEAERRGGRSGGASGRRGGSARSGGGGGGTSILGVVFWGHPPLRDRLDARRGRRGALRDSAPARLGLLARHHLGWRRRVRRRRRRRVRRLRGGGGGGGFGGFSGGGGSFGGGGASGGW